MSLDLFPDLLVEAIEADRYPGLAAYPAPTSKIAFKMCGRSIREYEAAHYHEYR